MDTRRCFGKLTASSSRKHISNNQKEKKKAKRVQQKKPIMMVYATKTVYNALLLEIRSSRQCYSRLV